MEINNLKMIVNGLVKQYGETGAREYISTGDYSYELKALAISLIKDEKREKVVSAMVIESDLHDVENPWNSGSHWSVNQAS